MLFEVLTFRSLFRNTRLEYRRTEGVPKIDYEWEKWLWLAAILFHYSFFVIFLRHFRFFTEPVPGFVTLLQNLDGFMQMGAAPFNGFGLPGADYFPLFLILALGFTGMLMRYLLRVDVTKVKELAIGLFKFSPTAPEGIGVIFYIHLFILCVLIAYFPFSKLMHLAGVFLSPTRNLANNNRFVRHVNPWNYPVPTHTYEEYEDEFREHMIEAGLPVEKGADTTAETEEKE